MKWNENKLAEKKKQSFVPWSQDYLWRNRKEVTGQIMWLEKGYRIQKKHEY